MHWPIYLNHIIIIIVCPTAKKSVQKLSEDDQDIIDLDKVESSMEAAINALKYEYTNSIITRITPGWCTHT